MGSPSNVLGFGPYSLDGSEVANYWILENNDCQVAHYGDVRAAQYLANPWCDVGAALNPSWKRSSEDRFSGYTFIVTIPAGLDVSSTLMIFDPGKCRAYGNKPADGHWNQNGRGTSLEWRTWDTNDTPLISGDDTPATAWWSSDECAADLPYGAGSWTDTTQGWTTTPFVFPPNPTSSDQTHVVQTRVLDSTRQGWNHYSYWVRPNNGTTSCSTLTLATCPTIGAESWIATQARGTANGVAMDLYLAEIGREHAGRTLKVSLWDPGEGMDNIQIVDSLGRSLDFTWESDDPAHANENPSDTCSGVPCLYLDPSNRKYAPKLSYAGWGKHYRFNGRNVTLNVPLDSQVDFDAYESAPLGNWFRLRFYPLPNKTANEWASFSVQMSGDPIRLTD